jgi:hypothetical protein
MLLMSLLAAQMTQTCATGSNCISATPTCY